MYTYKIKGQIVTISKNTWDCGTVQWYFQVNGEDAADQYYYKRTAKAAAEEWVDENY
tara:strand:- start:322 stop:492 length:171 start_codon:yes stop_codon:yes gene_type:complete